MKARNHKRAQLFGSFQREISIIILAACTLFISLALFSYNPLDSSWSYYSSADAHVTNFCGVFGAHCAAILFYLFGSASLCIVALLLFILYARLFNHSFAREWDRVAAYCVLLCVVATLCNSYSVDFLGSPYPGGLVGMSLKSVMHRWLDDVGSAILLYALFLICLILLIRFSCLGMIHWCVQRVHKALGKQNFFASLYNGLRSVTRACATVSVKVGAFFTTLFKHTHDATCQECDYAQLDLESTAQADQFWTTLSASRVDVPAQPAVESMRAYAPHPAPATIPVVVAADSVTQTLDERASEGVYRLPNLQMFVEKPQDQHDAQLADELKECARLLEEKLERFGVSGQVVAIKTGPVVTLFEYQPQIDAKISKIVAMEDDLALALRALSIRIIAPIPGRSVVGFEIANKHRKMVSFAEVVRSDAYAKSSGALPMILGQDIVGNNVVVDLAKMPHVLVAGSTGSGKSVALNVMLMSLLCKRSPQELKLILVDPKRLEFAAYADIAHLIFPIVVDPKKVVPVLQWVVREMEQRYVVMAKHAARNIADFNNVCEADKKLPHVVVIIDELADVMMTAGRMLEDQLARIAQMARAAGIHMIIATQRPSVDVITGLIKVNFPTRVSCRVTSKVDSRTILDCTGAEKLLGRGDMLFLDANDAGIKRVHGAYVSDKEIADLVAHIRKQRAVEYCDMPQEPSAASGGLLEADDGLYQEVISFIQGVEEVSISLLQRKFRIGYNRSARIIDMLESQGLIMPSEGGKTRKVIK